MEVICGVPERVGAARFDDAGGSVAGRDAGVRAHAGNRPGGEGSNHCRTGSRVDKERPGHQREGQGSGEGQHRELRRDVLQGETVQQVHEEVQVGSGEQGREDSDLCDKIHTIFDDHFSIA